MRCPECDLDNRPGVSFCEQCGSMLFAAAPQVTAVPAAACPDCGFPNRAGVSFCEQCGHTLLPAAPETARVTAAAPETTTCRACGFPNRAGVSFCEQCGSMLFAAVPPVTAVPATARVAAAAPETTACPACGFGNRVGVSFCEQCGHTLLPATPPAGRAPRRRRVAWAVAAAVLVLAGAGVGAFFAFRPGGGSSAADLVAELPEPAQVTDCTQLGRAATQFLDAVAWAAADEDWGSLAPEVAAAGQGYSGRADALACDEAGLVAQIQSQAVPAEGAAPEEVTRFFLSGGYVPYPRSQGLDLSSGGG